MQTGLFSLIEILHFFYIHKNFGLINNFFLNDINSYIYMLEK